MILSFLKYLLVLLFYRLNSFLVNANWGRNQGTFVSSVLAVRLNRAALLHSQAPGGVARGPAVERTTTASARAWWLTPRWPSWTTTTATETGAMSFAPWDMQPLKFEDLPQDYAVKFFKSFIVSNYTVKALCIGMMQTDTIRRWI